MSKEGVILTRRKEMTELLKERSYTTYELAGIFDVPEKEIERDLRHIVISQRQKDHVIIFPSQCLSCGYTFEHRKKVSKPSKCPKCKSTYLTKPKYMIKLKKKKKKNST